MIVVGIDPSKARPGWGVVERVAGGRESVLAYGALNEPTSAMIAEIATRWAPVADVVIIEDQFLARGPRMDPNAMKLVCRAAGRWEQAFGERGGGAMYVAPQTWQTLLLLGLCAGNAPRDQRKKAAKKLIERTFGLVIKTDEADALCLALWGLRTQRMPPRRAPLG